jgi:hypothetical protein
VSIVKFSELNELVGELPAASCHPVPTVIVFVLSVIPGLGVKVTVQVCVPKTLSELLT